MIIRIINDYFNKEIQIARYETQFSLIYRVILFLFKKILGQNLIISFIV